MISHVKLKAINNLIINIKNILGIAEFDNETITLEAFCLLTNYKLNFEISEKENFNWKISKPFNLNERQLEIQLRVSEKDVFYLNLL